MALPKYFLRGLGIFFLALLLTLIIATPALAFDYRTGTNVTIGSGETVNDDLYLFGTNITIDGTVNGDIFAFGQSVYLNGAINGSVTTAAQTIRINGRVSRSVRAAGYTIDVGGTIERDLVAAGSTVNVARSARIGGDLILGAQTSNIDGTIVGDIKADSTKITLSDGVGGNVEITSDQVIITSTADIRGNLTYTSQNEASIQSGSRVGGTTSHKQPEPARSARNFFVVGIVGTIIGRIFWFLTLFVIGLILILVVPKFVSVLANAIRRSPASTLGWGALLLFITPIAAIIVMFTIIGLPLGLISLVLWGIAVYLSEIPVALILGWLILRGNRDLGSRGIMVGAFALGLFIISLITAIPIVGWIIWLFVAMFGLGTLISAWRGPRIVA